MAGPFKGHGGSNFMVNEKMLGETPEALTYGFGNAQGISSTDKGTRAVPSKEDAEHWVSNCGPSSLPERMECRGHMGPTQRRHWVGSN